VWPVPGSSRVSPPRNCSTASPTSKWPRRGGGGRGPDGRCGSGDYAGERAAGDFEFLIGRPLSLGELRRPTDFYARHRPYASAARDEPASAQRTIPRPAPVPQRIQYTLQPRRLAPLQVPPRRTWQRHARLAPALIQEAHRLSAGLSDRMPSSSRIAPSRTNSRSLRRRRGADRSSASTMRLQMWPVKVAM
jgi:hypothetical protein